MGSPSNLVLEVPALEIHSFQNENIFTSAFHMGGEFEVGSLGMPRSTCLHSPAHFESGGVNGLPRRDTDPPRPLRTLELPGSYVPHKQNPG